MTCPMTETSTTPSPSPSNSSLIIFLRKALSSLSVITNPSIQATSSDERTLRIYTLHSQLEKETRPIVLPPPKGEDAENDERTVVGEGEERVTLRRHRLILVSEIHGAQDPGKDQDPVGEAVARNEGAGVEVFVFGVVAIEYFHFAANAGSEESHNQTEEEQVQGAQQGRLLESFVYIEKIDSTGLNSTANPKPTTSRQPHNLAPTLKQSIIHAYLRFCTSPAFTSALVVSSARSASLSKPPKLSIHTFARAQPQYLFPHSARNTGKRVLSARGLVAWWKRTFEGGGWWGKCGVQKGYWYVPNETLATVGDMVSGRGVHHSLSDRNTIFSTKRAVSPSTSDNNETDNLTWTWGFPYPPALPASTAIPYFPDDPKSRALRLLGNRALVSEFVQVLGAMSECASGNLCGFFTVVIEGGQVPDGDQEAKDVDVTGEGVGDHGLAEGDFMKIINALVRKGDFSNMEKGVASTAVVKGAMEKIGVTNGAGEAGGVPWCEVRLKRGVDVPESVDEAFETGAGLREVDAQQGITTHEQTLPTGVMNLQGLVKKKRKTEEAAGNVPENGTEESGTVAGTVVNDLQRFVKRKKIPTLGTDDVTTTPTAINDLQGLVKRTKV
ncbi:hypothetical protein HK102_004873 [Quaeritorhiza haematococci]|nr:hypothetical protein HK102_004873 [Quaeritorhiza haematococci]